MALVGYNDKQRLYSGVSFRALKAVEELKECLDAMHIIDPIDGGGVSIHAKNA